MGFHGVFGIFPSTTTLQAYSVIQPNNYISCSIDVSKTHKNPNGFLILTLGALL